MTEQQRAELERIRDVLYPATGLEDYDEEIIGRVLKDINALLAQDALHKMAEESRTSGLRLDDWDKIGCVNHDCDQCKAREQDNFCDKNCVWTDHHPDCKAVQEPVAPVPNGPYSAPIKELWPVAPKPWVGLSEEEVYEAAHYCVKSGQSVNETIRAIEAKLRSKNEY
jgi:hypothetical protein